MQLVLFEVVSIMYINLNSSFFLLKMYLSNLYEHYSINSKYEKGMLKNVDDCIHVKILHIFPYICYIVTDGKILLIMPEEGKTIL